MKKSRYLFLFFKKALINSKAGMLVAVVIFTGMANCAGTYNNKIPSIAKNATDTMDSISFIEDNWNEALKKAAATNKPIFVDAYATWCVPCKQLKATTFKDKEVADFFNTHFINLSLDVEKGEGVHLAEQWKIQGLPTLIILDHAGKQITQSLGYIGSVDLLNIGKQTMYKNSSSK